MNQLKAKGAKTSAVPVSRRPSVRPENSPRVENASFVAIHQFPDEFSSPTLQSDGTLHPLLTLQMYPPYPWSSISQPLGALEPPRIPSLLAEESLTLNRPNCAGGKKNTSDEGISSADSSLSSSSSFEIRERCVNPQKKAQPSLPIKSPMNKPFTPPARRPSQLTPAYFKAEASIWKLPGTPGGSCLNEKTAPVNKTPESRPGMHLLMTPGKATSQTTNANRSEIVHAPLPTVDGSLGAGGPKKRKLSKAPIKMWSSSLSSFVDVPHPAPERNPSTPGNAVNTQRKLTPKTPATPHKMVVGTPTREGLKVVSIRQVHPLKRGKSSLSDSGVGNESTHSDALPASRTPLLLIPNPPTQFAQTTRPGTSAVGSDTAKTSVTRQSVASLMKDFPGLFGIDEPKTIEQRFSILEKEHKEYGERILRLEKKIEAFEGVTH